MKKICLLLLAFVFTVSLLGCEKKEEIKVKDIPESSTEDWGLKLSLKDVTESGATLVFEQSGGNPIGELETGEDYRIYVKENDEWVEMPYIIDNGAWNSMAYIIAKNNVTEFEVQWEWLYGKLPEGTYVIEKEVMDFKGTGNYVKGLYYAGFEIM